MEKITWKKKIMSTASLTLFIIIYNQLPGIRIKIRSRGHEVVEAGTGGVVVVGVSQLLNVLESRRQPPIVCDERLVNDREGEGRGMEDCCEDCHALQIMGFFCHSSGVLSIEMTDSLEWWVLY